MLKSINKVIKIMIASDVALLTGFGFITPIFAIFITQRITAGNTIEAAEIAGFTMGIYWGVKSIFQIPFGQYLDKVEGERDDLWFVVIGNLLAALAVLGYIFSYLPWHIYLCQGIYSLGMAINIPGWCAIFTRHIDKGKEAFEWSTRSTIIGIGAAASGTLGGVVAAKFGFNILFMGVAFFALASALLPFLIYKDVAPKNHSVPRVPEAKGLQEPYLPKG
ncbi:MAG TPA: MFS transporter [Candidatus Humimicrobiaceae bacterium]|nr:MFS transporter [Candidatus Humimicrobiaceae bacterium]